jgi:hypothetical protein
VQIRADFPQMAASLGHDFENDKLVSPSNSVLSPDLVVDLQAKQLHVVRS